MLRLAIGFGIASALAAGLWAGAVWLRNDAVRDFVRDSALAAAERRAANEATKNRIKEEVQNASIDDLRERALSGGMFVDSITP